MDYSTWGSTLRVIYSNRYRNLHTMKRLLKELCIVSMRSSFVWDSDLKVICDIGLSTDITGGGSLAALRISRKRSLSRSANAGAKTNPPALQRTIACTLVQSPMNWICSRKVHKSSSRGYCAPPRMWRKSISRPGKLGT